MLMQGFSEGLLQYFYPLSVCEEEMLLYNELACVLLLLSLLDGLAMLLLCICTVTEKSTDCKKFFL